MQNLAEDAYAQEQAKAAKEEADKQTEENGKTLTKKARMAKQKAAEREVDALKEATEGRMEAEVVLDLLCIISMNLLGLILVPATLIGWIS